MKRLSFPHTTLSVTVLIAVIFTQCASVYKSHYSELIPRYPGTAALSLTDSSLIEGITSTLFTFGDTFAVDTITELWDEINKQAPATASETPGSAIEPLPVMAALLKRQGYTVATINPDFYECLFALSKLPLLMWVLVIHHQEDKPAFITRKNVTFFHTSDLSHAAPDMQLHLIRNIIKSDDTYKIITQDRFTLSGLATDHCNAQILSGNKNTTAKYLQIIDCFIVSLLPLTEIQEHIDEWYTTTPYKYVKPEIQELE